ncbi:MAG TPA: ABC transporter substrate-binding protein [Candidatus Methylomirabilis sp.]|jgi:NitT/TauT family transport system substrate-binding protein
MAQRLDGNGAWRVGALAGLIALAALSPAGARAQEEVVKVGDIPLLSNAGLYIAVEKGYFRERGIRSEVSLFVSSAKMVPALTAGEIEVSLGTASAGLFNAIAQGAGFRVVADKGQNRPGFGYTMLAVRKDLMDSGRVKNVKDLKGRKVALFAKGIVLDYFLGKLAEEEGLGIKDFETTFLAAPNHLPALESKAIDAALTVEPWGVQLEERGAAVRFRTADQVKGTGSVQTGVIMYSDRFIRERRAVAQRWMDAYLKGCEYYAAKGAQDAEVLAIAEKYTKVPARVIRAATPFYLDPTGRVNLKSLADQIRWYAANGYMTKEIGVDQVADLSFLK